jgi:ADP-ribose pyrophosphatase YjhB (NUDIX family)
VTGPEVAVGAVACHDDRLLLVRRGRPPAVGEWSVPGGRVEAGEPIRAAVVREVAEETGLTVTVGDFLGWVERFDTGHHYVILDFRVAVVDVDQPPRAGDDAAEAAWIPTVDLGGYPLVAGLADFLQDLGVLDPG